MTLIKGSIGERPGQFYGIGTLAEHDQVTVDAVKDLHPDMAANEIIGLPRGPDTAHIYRAFAFMQSQQRNTERSLMIVHEAVQRVSGGQSDMTSAISLDRFNDLVESVRKLTVELDNEKSAAAATQAEVDRLMAELKILRTATEETRDAVNADAGRLKALEESVSAAKKGK